jgi:beta-lactamase regulating signal transducer with metallopeptidase domain
MINIFEYLQRFIFSFLLWESVLSTALFLVLIPVILIVKNRYLTLQLLFYSIVLLRFVLPYDYIRVPFNKAFFNPNDIFQQYAIDQNAAPASFEYISDDQHSAINNPAASKVLNAEAILFLLWISGFAFSLFWVYNSRRKYHQMIKKSIEIKNREVLYICRFWQKKLKRYQTIKVYSGETFDTPFTMGSFNCKIYIPQSVLNSNRVNLKAIIGHEMLHIQRYDDLKLLFQLFIQSIFFFHPLIYYINRKIYLLNDMICDRKMIGEGGIPKARLADTLLQISEHYFRKLRIVNLFNNSAKEMKTRLINIFEEKPMKKMSLTIVTLIYVSSFAAISMVNYHLSEATKDKVNVNNIIIKNALPIQSGKVSSNFGDQLHPITKEKRHHDGIDIKAKEGTPIYSAFDGVVKFSGEKGDYGILIHIEHSDSLETLYAHLKSSSVKQGEAVKAGTVIGECGNTGLSTGSHLHFEIKKSGKAVNPSEYFNFAELKDK